MVEDGYEAYLGCCFPTIPLPSHTSWTYVKSVACEILSIAAVFISLKISRLVLPSFLLFFKMVLAFLVSLPLHINFRIILSIVVNKSH